MIPSALTTAGATSAFNFHSFHNSICKSWCLSIFSCSFMKIFWSLGMAMSMIKQLFTVLSMHTISSCLCSITLSGRSHKNLHTSFSSNELGTCSCHLSLHSRSIFLHNSQWVFFATSSYLFQYWFCQIRVGANDVCDTFNIFDEKPAAWSFAGLVSTVIH